MDSQTYETLCRNLERTLAHLERTLELLNELSTTLQTATAEELVCGLNQLSKKETESRDLARERGALLMTWNRESFLEQAPREDRRSLTTLFSRLTETINCVRGMQERVWAVLSVRARVVEITLRILTGGSSPTYESNGHQRTSGARSILEHRC